MSHSPNGKGTYESEKPKQSESPFEPFPQPRGWSANWEGSALHNAPLPTTTPNKPNRS
ncbi:MAG: hypothetical protein K8S97_10395 [Anaerolineae bacterium]|nr:hypothetical protein [Anaerolineae bacterium]